MKILITILVIVLVVFITLTVETGQNEANDSKVQIEACMSCHNAIINLKGRGEDTIISQTKAIKLDKKPHPPAGIKELSDQDIAAIAKFLNKS